MTIRLAHLSDIHFGRNFDLALWKAVRCEVINFRPHLLIVSGDMVDNPNPIQLLAANAKACTQQLETLARCNSNVLFCFSRTSDHLKAGCRLSIRPLKASAMNMGGTHGKSAHIGFFADGGFE